MITMKYPKCHSNRVEKTTLGSAEEVGTYAIAIAGVAAMKISASLFGLRTATPKMSQIKDNTNWVPRQYKCLNCGHEFHGKE